MNSAVANLAASREGERHRSEVDIMRKLEDLLPFFTLGLVLKQRKLTDIEISED